MHWIPHAAHIRRNGPTNGESGGIGLVGAAGRSPVTMSISACPEFCREFAHQIGSGRFRIGGPVGSWIRPSPIERARHAPRFRAGSASPLTGTQWIVGEIKDKYGRFSSGSFLPAGMLPRNRTE